MPQQPAPAGLDRRRHFALSAYWFSLGFYWAALVVWALLSEIVLAPQGPGRVGALWVMLVLGALVAGVVQPLAGAASDSTGSRWGRRRPYMVAGTLLCLAVLVVLGFYVKRPWPFWALLLVQLGTNVARAPYQGLMADVVPPGQRGAASAYMTAMTLLGTLAGAVAVFACCGVSTGLKPPLDLRPGGVLVLYALAGAVLAAGAAVTGWGVKEERPVAAPAFDWRSVWRGFLPGPRRHPGFFWAWVTRFVTMVGFGMVLQYLYHYGKDLRGPQGAVLPFLVVQAVLPAALLGALVAGRSSDRLDRRRVVCAAGLIMCFVLAATTALRMWIFLLVWALFGLGYGAYLSSNWALALDVLPSPAHSGRHLGVFSLATTLPQVVGLGALAPVLDAWERFGRPAQLRLSFLVACACFVLGSVVVWLARKDR